MLDYRHFLKLTDETGILQFSRTDIPDNNSGHTLDDNARALMVAINMGDSGYELADKYLSFMERCQLNDGTWSNLFINGSFSATINSEDSVGRALLACSLGSICTWEDIQKRCQKLLKDNLPRVLEFLSPRGIAYTLLALAKGPPIKKMHLMNGMAEYLLNLYKSKKTANWYWFEDYITYCNGILPQAMIAVYEVNNDKRFLKAGLDSLNFLNEIMFREGYLNIIGNQGWYQKGGEIPLFDQQPVDAASIAFACHEAYIITAKSEYLDLTRKAYAWYYGDNIHQLSLYNEKTGGCFDALTPEGVNYNQGAEAVLSKLMTEQLLVQTVSLHKEAEAK